MPGGRPKGSGGLRKDVLIKLLKEKYGKDFHPVEKMVDIAVKAEADGDIALAGQMYAQVSKYVEPALKAVEHKGAMGGDMRIEIVKRVVGSSED